MVQAVQAVLKFKDQIFFIKRSKKLSVFPGYCAFVGGKVDKVDEKSRDPKMAALVREVEEEISFDLTDEEFVESIDYFSKSRSPDFIPYKFETFYYVVNLKKKPSLGSYNDEIDKVFWVTPSEFFKMYDRGECLVVPPIINIFKNVLKEAPENLNKLQSNQVPVVEPIKDVLVLYPFSNTFPPALRTNSFVIGTNKKIIVDPSPKDESEYQKLLKSIEGINIELVFITHHHRDHNEYADRLARELNVSIYCSLDTHDRIINRWDKNFFDGLNYIEVKEGDVITDWLDQDVYAFAVPGHDEGQMALAPRDNQWVLVSDLIQTIGTVVVGGDEGDMKKYFQSLERVIEMKPEVIFPSHGIAQGGVEKLRITLNHRKIRERQINDLFLSGKNIEEILGVVYEGLDEKLIKYARKTIVAHLKALGHM